MSQHHGTRRVMATGLVALGLGSLAAPVAADAAPQRVASHGLLDGIISSLPVPIPQLSPTQLTTLLGQVAAADPTGALPMVVAQLTPAQVVALVSSPSGLTGVLDGLGTIVTSLLGGQPSAGQVDVVVQQLNAILAGGLPTDPSQLADLQTILAGLPQLLQVPGIDGLGLQELQRTVAGLLGVDPGTLPGAGGLPTSGTSSTGALVGLLGIRPTPATTTTSGTAGATPGGAGAGATGQAAARDTRFRARVTRVRVAKGNRVVRARLSCPAAAPSCVVAVILKAGATTSKPRFYGMRSATTKRIRLTVPRAATRRLARRGGVVRVTAATMGSSLAPVTKRTRATRG